MLGRPPLCQKSDIDEDDRSEDELRRQEGLATNDDVHALEHIARLLTLLTRALQECANNDKGQVAGRGLE